MATSTIKNFNLAGGSVTGMEYTHWYRHGDICCVVANNSQRTMSRHTTIYGLPKPKQGFVFKDGTSDKKFIISYDTNGGFIQNEDAIDNEWISFCVTYPCQ